MVNSEEFQNTLRCVCNEDVILEVIGDVECDWGIHTVIQCPKCEELFSIDKECPAFQSILKLAKLNPQICSKEEESDYLSNSHPK